MGGFPGFPAGNLKVTPVPDLFFSELLPLVDNLVELKVTLHCLWLFRQRGDEAPVVTAAELEEDELLLRGLLAAVGRERRSEPGRAGRGGWRSTERQIASELLREGLECAMGRGTLLQVSAQGPSGNEPTWYILNSERGRAAIERMERGEWTPACTGAGAEAGAGVGPGAVQLRARRPNIYNLYEQNVGLIQSPMLAEELTDAERTYPPEWIEEAFRIAVANNVRRWAYVQRILERWAQEGRGPQRDGEDQSERPRTVDDKYADYIKH
jgi:DnaD/phage-associated family protein